MKAYVETTILANILLKPGSEKESSARAGLARYDRTLLPVYAIKEFKAGPLDKYAYVHDKLLQTKSLSSTIDAIGRLGLQPNRLHTSLEALAVAVRLASPQSAKDVDLADSYRLALSSLILRAWRNRRKITHEVVQDLDCYTETAPRLGANGLISMEPKRCDGNRECCLADHLKGRKDLLEKLRDAIPADSQRREDKKRRAVLRQLIKHDRHRLTRDECRDLGDAIFAFFAPQDCIILTTNIKDHKPLANAIGKDAVEP